MFLNTFKPMPATAKAEETATRILEAALSLFRQQGFDAATMRDIAAAAGVATGAAYYYYPSKEAIVLDFYQRTSEEMQPKIREALNGRSRLDARLRGLIDVKLQQFADNRAVLRALLRSGADPKHPLSPFGDNTAAIRETDLGWFREILVDCGFGIPRDLEPHLPGVLWFFQMGIILFWIVDDSPNQTRTTQLLNVAIPNVARLIRVSSLPLLRPVRKGAIEIVEIVKSVRE
jgi:AcrR family transcriptional regulator